MKDMFIKVNHIPIRLSSIVGLRAPYYIETEKEIIKKKKNGKTVFGPPKLQKKTRLYCFDVITYSATFSIIPSLKCYSPSSNSKGRCLIEYGRICDLLLNLKNEEKDKSPGESTLHKQI
jgi:hypothetical protein